MKIIMACTFLFFLLLFSGCGMSEPERSLSAIVDYMDDMTDILKTVKDGPTALKAEPKLAALVNCYKGISTGARPLTFFNNQIL